MSWHCVCAHFDAWNVHICAHLKAGRYLISLCSASKLEIFALIKCHTGKFQILALPILLSAICIMSFYAGSAPIHQTTCQSLIQRTLTFMHRIMKLWSRCNATCQCSRIRAVILMWAPDIAGHPHVPLEVPLAPDSTCFHLFFLLPTGLNCAAK